MRVHLGGHLNWYDPQKRTWLDWHLTERVPLVQVLRQIGVPADEVGVAAVNGAAVPLEEVSVGDADCVELYPPIGGGSA